MIYIIIIDIYFNIERLPYIKVPLHTVIKLTPMAYGCMMERIPLSIEGVNTQRSKPKVNMNLI